jgi:uncharacterized membrane protein YhhN
MAASHAVMALAISMGIAVVAVLFGEGSARRWLVVAAKPIASMGFVAIAWLGIVPNDPYGAWVFVALVACLAGDVLLLFPSLFKAGLTAFLVGHLAFIVAFHALVPASAWPVAWSLPVVAVSVLVSRRLIPHLGRMRAPVLAYVAIITVMVWGAVSVAIRAPSSARVATGALLFYVSDLAVARDRFLTRAFVNRAWGLPAYYLGQLLLALSVQR